MTTMRDEGPSPAVRTLADLVDHLATGERAPEGFRVGTEYEKLAVHHPSGAPLAYEPRGGRPGIRTLLEELARTGAWRPVHEGPNPIALDSDEGSITLEPGGQFELSGAPRPTIHEMVAELRRHEEELAQLTAALPVRWLWCGMDPVHDLDAIDWMPKARYEVMRRYLPTRGRLAHVMMKATCTVQANLDHAGEADMGRKLRTAMGLSSIVNALFANSPLLGGRPSGWKSYRWHVWTETDPDRSGLLRWVFEGDPPTYERYARWAIDVPMFFVVRPDVVTGGSRYVPCAGMPFRRLLEGRFEGHEATLADWTLHLSTLFPDVRLKTYLEVRSADCVKPPFLPALPALWKGVLYDGDALEAAWDLVRGWTFDERLDHREAAAKDALAAPAPGGRYGTADLARELLRIARHGLARQAEARGHADESPYLDALESLVRRGLSPADETLAWFARSRPETKDVVRHYEADWTEPRRGPEG